MPFCKPDPARAAGCYCAAGAGSAGLSGAGAAGAVSDFASAFGSTLKTGIFDAGLSSSGFFAGASGAGAAGLDSDCAAGSAGFSGSAAGLLLSPGVSGFGWDAAFGSSFAGAFFGMRLSILGFLFFASASEDPSSFGLI